MRSPDLIPALIFMSDSRPDMIWRLQAQRDIRGLVLALKDPTPATRKRAAAALRTIHATQSVSALRLVVGIETDPEARETMLSAIEALDSPTMEIPLITVEPSVMDALAEKLRHADSAIAIQAAQDMADLGDKAAVVPLILCFTDSQTPIQVRLAVAETLLKLESAPVEVALLANLRHVDWMIRRNAAAILGQLRSEWATEPLGKALADPHPTVRKTALAALKYIGTPDARKVLARFANEIAKARQLPPAPSDTQIVAAVASKDTPPTAPDPQTVSALLLAPDISTTPLADATLMEAPRSRLLDKAAETSEIPQLSLPKDIKVMRVSEQKGKLADKTQSDRTTAVLDEGVVEAHEQRSPTDPTAD